MDKPYEGPVWFDGGGPNPTYFHYGRTRLGRRVRLVSIDGKFYRSKRTDPDHQARYHRQFAGLQPF